MKKPKHYVNDNELYYNIYISKGKGKLEDNSIYMFIMISKNVARRFHFSDVDERFDATQQGLLMMLEKWRSFDEEKYNKALPYFTEICKRGIIKGLNQLNQKKGYKLSAPELISVDVFFEKEYM